MGINGITESFVNGNLKKDEMNFYNNYAENENSKLRNDMSNRYRKKKINIEDVDAKWIISGGFCEKKN